MKVLAIGVAAFFFAAQGTSTDIEGTPALPYRAESSAHVVWAESGSTYVTENRSFQFTAALSDDGNDVAGLLLEEAFQNESTEGIEGMRGNATVTAWTLSRERPRELRWTLKDAGNEGMVLSQRFYRTTAWGCCSNPTVYSYYSLLTGKKLYFSNSDLLEVWTNDETPKGFRYIAFGYASMHADQPPQLQYGTDTSVIQRYSVVSSRPEYDPAEMFLSARNNLGKSLDLRGSPTDFTIVLRYGDGVELHVPVEADAVQPEKARLPAGYSLRSDN